MPFLILEFFPSRGEDIVLVKVQLLFELFSPVLGHKFTPFLAITDFPKSVQQSLSGAKVVDWEEVTSNEQVLSILETKSQIQLIFSPAPDSL